jgi:hypothetical protein
MKKYLMLSSRTKLREKKINYSLKSVLHMSKIKYFLNKKISKKNKNNNKNSYFLFKFRFKKQKLEELENNHVIYRIYQEKKNDLLN